MHGDGQDRPRLESRLLVHARIEAGVRLRIVDDGRLAVLHDPAGDASTRGNVLTLHGLTGLPGGDLDGQLVARVVEQHQRARLGAGQLGGRRHDLAEQLVELQRRVQERGDLQQSLERLDVSVLGGHLVSPR